MANPSENSLFAYGPAEWTAEPDTAFDAFLTNYRFNNRKLRASSFAIYRGMFGRLKDWAWETQGLSLFDLKEHHIEQFLDRKVGGPDGGDDGHALAAETRHRYLLLFTNLFEHLARVKAGGSSVAPVVTDNPARALLLEREAPAREDPEWLTDAELPLFIAALPEGDGWKRVRDRAMVFLVLGAGLRSSEVLALKTTDLQLKAGALESAWVQAQKPRPARQVPVLKQMEAPVVAWLMLREQLANPDAAPLGVVSPKGGRPKKETQRLAGTLVFPGNLAGAPLQPVTLFRLVKNTLAAAGISKRYEGPTLLRNTCGARWLKSQEPLQVSLWMGHATVRTTELLLPPEQRALAEAVSKRPTGTTRED